MNLEQKSGDSFLVVFCSRYFPPSKLRTMVLRRDLKNRATEHKRDRGREGREMTTTCSQGLEKIKNKRK